MSNVFNINGLCVPIKSTTSNDTYYVTLKIEHTTNQPEWDCTCRLKFGLTNKRKCKHITYVNTILEEHIRSGINDLNNNNLENVFSNLKI